MTSILSRPQCVNERSFSHPHSRTTQWQTTTNHNKPRTGCIFIGIYYTCCMLQQRKSDAEENDGLVPWYESTALCDIYSIWPPAGTTDIRYVTRDPLNWDESWQMDYVPKFCQIVNLFGNIYIDWRTWTAPGWKIVMFQVICMKMFKSLIILDLKTDLLNINSLWPGDSILRHTTWTNVVVSGISR